MFYTLLEIFSYARLQWHRRNHPDVSIMALIILWIISGFSFLNVLLFRMLESAAMNFSVTPALSISAVFLAGMIWTIFFIDAIFSAKKLKIKRAKLTSVVRTSYYPAMRFGGKND